MTTIDQLIARNLILIVSGEGEEGHTGTYTGKRTMRAIKQRLARERCGGDRWAIAKVYSHTNEGGDVYLDIDTGEYC